MNDLDLQLHIGAEVFWNDPDNGIGSGFYEVTAINGEVYSLKNECGSTIEAFESELS